MYLLKKVSIRGFHRNKKIHSNYHLFDNYIISVVFGKLTILSIQLRLMFPAKENKYLTQTDQQQTKFCGVNKIAVIISRVITTDWAEIPELHKNI